MQENTLDQIIDRVISMAKESPEDRYAGIASEEVIAKDIPNIELFDPVEPSPSELTERATIAEDVLTCRNRC